MTVLKDQTNQVGMNVGFKLRDNQMYTYTQVKDALTYLYPKRKVLSDGVTTLPLDL